MSGTLNSWMEVTAAGAKAKRSSEQKARTVRFFMEVYFELDKND